MNACPSRRWFALSFLAAFLICFAAGCNNNEAELTQLRQEHAELEQLRAQVQQLQQKQTPDAEMARLRKENEEVHRLRNEIRQVRDELRQAQAAKQAAANNPLLTTENNRLKGEIEQIKANNAAQIAQNTCQNNIRQIGAAAQQWALQHQKPNGTPITPTEMVELARMLPGGRVPACPSGGAYGLFVVGGFPACSVPGHAVTQ